MLYHMHRVLSSEQNDKLRAMLDRGRRDRTRRGIGSDESRDHFSLDVRCGRDCAAQTPADVPPIAFNAVAQAQGPALDLRIDDAVARALERNLDIAVERLNPQTFDFSLAALYATYRPALTSQVGYRDQTTFSRSQTAGGDVLTRRPRRPTRGHRAEPAMGRGQLLRGLRQYPGRADRPLRRPRNPAVNTNLNAVFVQPLLRGFKTDTMRTQLRVTAINQDISEIQVETTVNNTLANVRNATGTSCTRRKPCGWRRARSSSRRS